ncbi:MAG TPA: phage tail tape measure protein, partial [Methylomirabilota bacterium]|nr:phage tail tape measure protein [Methylomirabilota bacterium]
LTTLTTGSKATIAEIKRLGLQITDSKGNFVGLGSIIEQLNPKLAKMGTVQREAALKALFGAGAAGVMNDVISEGRKKFDDLSNSIGRAGSAEDQASKATDNVRDKVKIFTSGIKDLAIKIGEAILPAINNLLGMLIGILPWFDRLGHWMAENKAVIAPVAKVLGVLAAAILAVWTATKLLSGIGSIFKTVFSIGGPGLIILGIAALIVAFVILWDKSKAFRDFWIGLWNDVKVAVSDAVKVISPLLESIGKAISTGIGIVTGKKDDKGRTVTPEHVSPPAPIQPPTPSVQFSQLPSKARPILVPGYVPPTPFSLDTGPASRPVHTSGYPDVPINTDTGLVPKPKQRLPVDLTRDSGLASAPDKPKQSTGPIDLKASNIPGMWQKIWDDVLKISRNVFGELKGRFHDLTVWISKEVDAIKNWWMSIWPLMKRPLADLWNAVKIAFNIIKVVVVVALYAIWETFKAVFTILGGIVKAAVDIIEGIIKGLAEIFAGLIDFFKGIFTGNWSLMWKGIIEIVDGVWAIIWGIIKGAWDIILAIIKAAWNLVKDIFGGAGVWLVKVVINIWNDVTGWFARMWHDIVGYFIGLGRDIGNISTGIWHWLVNTAKDIWRDVTGWFVNIWHDIVGYFIGLGRDIGNIAGWIWNTVTGWARNLWRNISDTFNRMVGDLIGIFRNLANWVFRNPINFVIDWVINRGLNDLVHGVGDLFGQNWNVHVGLIPQFAQGGIVPGTDTGKDTVHAMLRPGEGVLTPEAVKRVGGATTIEKLNRGQAPS